MRLDVFEHEQENGSKDDQPRKRQEDDRHVQHAPERSARSIPEWPPVSVHGGRRPTPGKATEERVRRRRTAGQTANQTKA